MEASIDFMNAFCSEDKKKDLSPRMLYENKSEQEAAEELAIYFNNISNEYEPLDVSKIPRTFEHELHIVTAAQVKKIN